MKKSYKYSNDAINIREMINKIKEKAQLLHEAYVYEDDMEMDEIEDDTFDGVEHTEGGREYVDAIRQSALKGIQVFAQDVDSPSYQFFKKVFMLADKVLSEKEGNGEEV